VGTATPPAVDLTALRKACGGASIVMDSPAIGAFIDADLIHDWPIKGSPKPPE
jgi:hypothetical protein